MRERERELIANPLIARQKKSPRDVVALVVRMQSDSRRAYYRGRSEPRRIATHRVRREERRDRRLSSRMRKRKQLRPSPDGGAIKCERANRRCR